MRLRVCLLFVLIPLVLGANPARTLATSLPSSDLLVLRSAAARMGRQPLARVIRWLDAQTAVRRAERGRDGRTLDICFRDGQEMLVLPAHEANVRLARIGELQLHRLARSQSPGGRAAVLTPFASELGYAGTGDIEATDLANAGLQVDQVSDAAVTVSLMASLSRYNVVYMHTHSGTTSGGDGVLATGQLAGGDASVAPLLQDGSVLPVGVAGDSIDSFYAVTSRFFALHAAPFPHDSILFLNGCKLLPATAFWQALSTKGAGAMVSWSEDAQAKDDYLSGAGFFNFMSQGMSIDGAIAALKANGFGISDYDGIQATLGYRGDGTITLSRAARGQAPGPTATTVPVPTATTIAPTATTVVASPTVVPSPTATRLSVPPLRIAGLRRQVAPKHMQQISVQTAPGVPVTLTVTFPDGRRVSTSMTADVSGAAKFSFAQPQNSITRHSNRAQISAQAGSGAEIASLSDTYTISYGPIDLSIEPREASAHSSVTLWVHTSAETTIQGRVTAPHHKPFALRGKTGPKGWAKLAYRVSAGVTAGQRISVSVVAQRAGRTVKTSAKLTIR